MRINENIGISAIYVAKLDHLFKNSLTVQLKSNNKFVIFSDLHLGDGKRNDDFKKNSMLYQTILRKYYLKLNFNLILNGDIEELQRFSLKSIQKQWKDVYKIWDLFYKKGHFYKLYGNHDEKYLLDRVEYNYPVHNSMIIRFKNIDILIIHGHQASLYFSEFNWFSGFFLKYFANIIGIKNSDVPFHRKIKYLTEKRIYEYSKYKKIISIMGHTHRPLFESLSKLDYLKHKVEDYCREYLQCNNKRRIVIQDEIRTLKEDIVAHKKKRTKYSLLSSLYSSDIILPCLFNIGCGIGKHGITSIELSNNSISLIHWFDRKVSKKYLYADEFIPEKVGDTDYYRVVLKSDSLQYITTRIKLLS